MSLLKLKKSGKFMTECGCVFFWISIVLIIVGIPLWSIGDEKEEFFSNKFFISIPLFPSDEKGVGPFYSKQIDTSIGPTHNSYPFFPIVSESSALNFDLESVPKYLGNSSKRFYLNIVHNLYSFKFKISLYCNDQILNTIEDDVNSSTNYFMSSFNFPPSFNALNDAFHYQKVYCPFPVLEPSREPIYPDCEKNFGFNTNILGNFSMHNTTMETSFKSCKRIRIGVDYFEAYPNDFNRVPQAYILFFREQVSKKRLIISGLVFTFSAIATFLFSIFLFIIC